MTDDRHPRASTRALSDAEWEQARDDVTRRYMGLSAAEFAARFVAGEYPDEDSHPHLMSVLMYFPELD